MCVGGEGMNECRGIWFGDAAVFRGRRGRTVMLLQNRKRNTLNIMPRNGNQNASKVETVLTNNQQ